MNKAKIKEIAVPAVSLLVICLVITALLAFTNILTLEPIAKVNAELAQKSREKVCPAASSFEQIELDGVDVEVFKALNENGDIIGYALATAAHGYGGDIKVMTGIDAETSTIIAINVYDNSGETPGLGANTSTEKFMSQYSGIAADNGFIVSKNASKEPQRHPVDAVTGATISSNAVNAAVNEAVDIYNNYCKEGE